MLSGEIHSQGIRVITLSCLKQGLSNEDECLFETCFWSPVKVDIIVVMCSSYIPNPCRSLSFVELYQSIVLIGGIQRSLFRNLNIIPRI